MKLRNAGRAVVTVTAAVFAISVMGGAFGTQVEQNFNDCMENSAQDDAARLRCCKSSGGSWVELYDEDGYVIDAFCDGAEEDWTDGGAEEPQEIRHQPARTTTTQGTLQQTSTPTPSKTFTTNGSYQTTQTAQPAPTPVSSTQTTSGTYARR